MFFKTNPDGGAWAQKYEQEILGPVGKSWILICLDCSISPDHFYVFTSQGSREKIKWFKISRPMNNM